MKSNSKGKLLKEAEEEIVKIINYFVREKRRDDYLSNTVPKFLKVLDKEPTEMIKTTLGMLKEALTYDSFDIDQFNKDLGKYNGDRRRKGYKGIGEIVYNAGGTRPSPTMGAPSPKVEEDNPSFHDAVKLLEDGQKD